MWRETTDRPLRLFGGFEELADAVPFYMPSQPFAVHVLDGAVSQAHGGAHRARRHRAGLPDALSGAPATGLCVDRAVARARCSLPGMQVEVEVFRRYLGVGGKRARYLIITIPPMQADRLPPLRDLATGYAARSVQNGMTAALSSVTAFCSVERRLRLRSARSRRRTDRSDPARSRFWRSSRKEWINALRAIAFNVR